MTETFTTPLTVALGAKVEPWAALSALWPEVVSCFEAAAGLKHDTDASGTSLDHKVFRRRSLDHLEDAFDVNHADPTRVDLFINRRGRGRSSISMVRATGYSHTESSLEIRVSGDSRLAVERMAHDLAGMLSRSRRFRRASGNPSPRVGKTIVQSDDDADGRDQGQGRRLVRPQTGWPRWLRTTWRDHTAAFAISVTAGLLVLIGGGALAAALGVPT